MGGGRTHGSGGGAVVGSRGDHGGRHGHGGRHFRGYGFYGGPAYGYYGYSDDDDCYWLRRRALDTGSRYWWRRYNECRY